MKNTIIRLSRVLFWVGLAAYFGGMLALGAVAAPEIFGTVREVRASSPVLPVEGGAATQLGGEIFGNVLKRFQVVEWVSLGLILVGFGAFWGRIGWRKWLLGAILVGLVAVGCADWFWVTPTIWKVRAQWREAVVREGEGSASGLKVRFDELHRTAEDLGMGKVYLLLGMIVVEAWGNGEKQGARIKKQEVGEIK